VLAHLGRKDEARAAYEKGIAQSEKHGHSGMADDIRLTLMQLGERN
jgi:predicted negative regulator of RcsB-dependent stress response